MDQQKLSKRLWVVIPLLIASFALDTTLPRGFADWSPYFFPLLLIWSTNALSIIVAVSIATVFEVLGFIASPMGEVRASISMVNRVAGVAIFWIISAISISRLRYLNRLKQQSDQLRESEGRLRLATEAAGIGTWSLDPASGAIDWDAITRDHWGFSSNEQLEFEKISGRVHPHDRSVLRRSIQLMNHNRDAYTFELRIVHPDGSLRYMRTTGRPLLDENGRVFRIIGTSLDVTEQKKTEQALRDYADGMNFLSETAWRMLQPLCSEELFRLVGERIYSLSGNRITIISEYCPLTQSTTIREVMCSAKERKTLTVLLQRDPVGIEIEITGAMRQKLVPGKLSRSGEGLSAMASKDLSPALLRRIEQDMEIRQVYYMSSSVEFDLLGTVVILGTSPSDLPRKDLIESTVGQASLALKRLHTEEQLREERNFVNSVLDSQGAIVAILDRSFRIIRLNRAYGEITGFDPESRVGWQFREIMQETEAEKVQHQLDNLTKDEVGEYENLVYTATGRTRYIRWRNTTIRDRNGDIEHIVATGLDITDRIESEGNIKRLNRELRRHTEELEFAYQELEAFSYSLTHDLRNPLGAIIGFAALLQEGCPEKHDSQECGIIKRILESGHKMNRLIEDMLTLSRVSRQEIRLEPADLGAIAKEVISELTRNQPRRPVSIQINSVPSCRCDSRLMRIALVNILGNAWKYTTRTDNPRIEFGCTTETGEPVFYVSDNGVGFDMAHAGELFVAFRRLHSEKEFPGTGVGLATVSRIIARHGGEIWARSEVGKGATFYFTLGGRE